MTTPDELFRALGRTRHYLENAAASTGVVTVNAPDLRIIIADRDELLATVRRQGDLLEFMAAYIGTPAKERETQWPAWSATESKKEAVADYWAELASAAIIQSERAG